MLTRIAGSPSFLPTFSVGLAMVSFILIKTGRDALFLSRQGLPELSLAFVAIAVASIPVAIVNVSSIRRFGMKRVRMLVLLLAGLMFLGMAPYLNDGGENLPSVLFVLVPVTFAAIFAGLWLLAAELLENATGESVRRVYSWVGAGSLAGGVVGGLLGKLLSASFSAHHLVGLGGLLLLLIALLVRLGYREESVKGSEDDSGSSGEDSGSDIDSRRMLSWTRLMRFPYVNGLVALSSLAAMVGLLIEFQFYAEVKGSGRSSTEFFAGFYTILSLVSLVLQLGVTPFVQSRLGVAGSLLVMPTGLVGGTAIASAGFGLLSASALRITESGLKSAIHRSSWEQAFLFLNRKLRAVAKALVDGLFARMAEGGTAMGIYLWLLFGGELGTNMGLVYILIFLGLGLWILLTLYLIRIGCGDSSETNYMVRLPDA